MVELYTIRLPNYPLTTAYLEKSCDQRDGRTLSPIRASQQFHCSWRQHLSQHIVDNYKLRREPKMTNHER
uniref:Uncharacterized protein n=1 Tax=Pristionchus pacificus TaxID=54126 RepID=A0A2A6CUU5_PRIPA